jgi:RimJ/RimL family protein N-acetyltransferase
MELVIRPAEPADSEQLLLLMATLANESTTFTNASDLTNVSVADQADNIYQLQATTNNIILLAASDDGDLFGLISAAAIPNHPRSAEVGVAVLAAYQGNGLAQILLDELIVWAKEFSTIDELRLTVQSANEPAVHIYEKFGFSKVPDSDTIILNSIGEPVAAFDMVLPVEE